MKGLVVLLFLVCALVDGYPARSWEKKQPGHDKKWTFEDWKVKFRSWEKKPWEEHEDHGEEMKGDDIPQVRWCVTNPCEMKKCKRMAMKFKYMVSPKMNWSCMMASCKQSCMEEIRLGHADIMTAEGEDIYMAGKVHHLIPIMFEKEDYKDVPDYDTMFAEYEGPDGNLKHYSIALVKKTTVGIDSFQDMKERKSCHSGVDAEASFKSPVCSLIEKGVMQRTGNVYESAGEFFKESCVPGVQQDMYNPNMTNPESLCKLCKGLDDDDFCETLSDKKEPYYGYSGMLKCLRDGAGDVGFVHTRDVIKNFEELSKEFDVVCRNKKLPLEWKNIIKKGCHLAEENAQVLMVSKDKPKDWIQGCTNALTHASTLFSSPNTDKAFGLFDSSLYCDKMEEDDEHSEEYKSDMSWMKNKDLIFKDCSSSLELIPEDKRTFKEFLGADTVGIWKTCAELESKPRAFMCVVGDEEMKKCEDMINKFQTVTYAKNISWGCIEASCKKECSEMVAKGLADIVDLNATDMFMAGMDYNLVPFMAETYKGKDRWTESITIGVMLKGKTDLPEDMRGWKMCNAGVDKISGFLHPMGWLLANGTIHRSSSPLKSIGQHFGESCVPGINAMDLTKYPLLSRTLDWRSMLKDKIVMWKDWYQAPLWRRWQDKESGLGDEYYPMYEMEDFESPNFRMLTQKMTSDDPSLRAYRTPEMQEVLELASKEFSWDNYGGLKDFYGLTMPKWKLIGWAFEKPEEWTEDEWQLFEMWAEEKWNQKEDWRAYTDKWTDDDWVTFKRWMDFEYKEYMKDHTPLHQDIFIRLSLLCSRYFWLMDQWANLQWDNVDIKHCREKLCESCAGEGDEKCSMDPIKEEYYGYEGALKCLKWDDGDVAFIDGYTFDDAIAKNGYTKDDFVLLCPDGKTVDYTGSDSFKECNYGRVPSNALVTCNMHDGVWRWKVTKALLEAQKVVFLQGVPQDTILGKDVESLTPIPFVNQTYQVWLGSMFLRAMEGVMQPPVKDKGFEEISDPMDECLGDECHDEVEDRPPCDMCEHEDTLCLEKCWSEELPEMTKPRGKGRQKSRKTEGRVLINGHQDYRGGKKRMMHNKKMQGKPGARKMLRMMKPGMKKMRLMKRLGMRRMGAMGHMRPMKYRMKSMMGPMKYGMKPMMGPMKYGMKPMMGPLKYGMKPVMYDMKHGMGKMNYMMRKKMMAMGHGEPMMAMKQPMMGQNMMKDKMMKGYKMMNYRMETGPIMQNDKTLRGEFYTKVIFERDGTCNAIVRDLSCFGKQKNIRMLSGRVGKTPISVPMCPRPTIMKKTTAQFTCDTGASFLKPVFIPMKCSYAPCNLGFWLPDWSNNQYWNGDNSYPKGYWGNKDWWIKRDENDNWFFTNGDRNRVGKN